MPGNTADIGLGKAVLNGFASDPVRNNPAAVPQVSKALSPVLAARAIAAAAEADAAPANDSVSVVRMTDAHEHAASDMASAGPAAATTASPPRHSSIDSTPLPPAAGSGDLALVFHTMGSYSIDCDDYLWPPSDGGHAARTAVMVDVGNDLTNNQIAEQVALAAVDMGCGTFSADLVRHNFNTSRADYGHQFATQPAGTLFGVWETLDSARAQRDAWSPLSLRAYDAHSQRVARARIVLPCVCPHALSHHVLAAIDQELTASHEGADDTMSMEGCPSPTNHAFDDDDDDDYGEI